MPSWLAQCRLAMCVFTLLLFMLLGRCLLSIIEHSSLCIYNRAQLFSSSVVVQNAAFSHSCIERLLTGTWDLHGFGVDCMEFTSGFLVSLLWYGPQFLYYFFLLNRLRLSRLLNVVRWCHPNRRQSLRHAPMDAFSMFILLKLCARVLSRLLLLESSQFQVFQFGFVELALFE